MEIKTLNNETWAANQSWHDERLLELDAHVCRTTVRRNAYDAQSYARVERWDGSQWQSVCNIPFPLWPDVVKAISYVQKGLTLKAFDTLVEALVKKAGLILS